MLKGSPLRSNPSENPMMFQRACSGSMAGRIERHDISYQDQTDRRARRPRFPACPMDHIDWQLGSRSRSRNKQSCSRRQLTPFDSTLRNRSRPCSRPFTSIVFKVSLLSGARWACPRRSRVTWRPRSRTDQRHWLFRTTTGSRDVIRRQPWDTTSSHGPHHGAFPCLPSNE